MYSILDYVYIYCYGKSGITAGSSQNGKLEPALLFSVIRNLCLHEIQVAYLINNKYSSFSGGTPSSNCKASVEMLPHEESVVHMGDIFKD